MAISYNLLKHAALGGAVVFLAIASVISVPAEPTMLSGQPYIDYCRDAHVPIPPRINQLATRDVPDGWKSQGIIPGTARLLGGGPAELLTFHTGEGVCFQLRNGSGDERSPLTADTTLDSIICLSTMMTSKACFWEKGGDMGLDIPAGVQVPIGVPDPDSPGGLYAAGGAELETAGHEACTDCHAGENPFIVHPRLHLKIPDVAHPDMLVDSPRLMNQLVGYLGEPIPMFAPARYDPIVHESWPQNALLETAPYVPIECKRCHNDDPNAEHGGRFPYLSNQLPGYCSSILPLAIARTMPPDLAPRYYSNDDLNWAFPPAMHPFDDWCHEYPTPGPSDRGDPHLTTTNGIKFDFQPAGEFTALRDSSDGFELQTRQTPITTSFVPDANAYTGLQSCVSLNTAVALRVGKRRITYQQRDIGEASAKNPLCLPKTSSANFAAEKRIGS